MCWTKIKNIFFFLSFLLVSPASAKVYDWVRMGPDDIEVITDGRIEAEVRLEMIRKATTSIEIVTFDQRFDPEVGLPFLEALSEAAHRGVKIRFVISWLSAPVKDPFNHVGNYLNRLVKLYPNFEYIFVGGSPMWNHGWGALDGIHEKLFIVDQRWCMTTGRGNGEEYLHWLDTAYLFKGKLVDQSIEAFETLWNTVSREMSYKKRPPTVSSSAHAIKPRAARLYSLSEAEVRSIEMLSHWLDLPSSESTAYRARLIHFDFLDQMRNLPGKPKNVGYSKRAELLVDPVVEEVVEQLKSASFLKFNILAVVLHPKVKESLITHLCNKLRVDVLTNGKESHGNVFPLSLPVGWFAGLPDLADLIPFPNFNAYQFKDKTDEKLVYSHRKLILLERNPTETDPRESTVIFGSHNLTYASSTTLDEMSFQIESDDFYKKMNDVFEKSLTLYGDLTNSSDILYEEQHSATKIHFARPFKMIFAPK